MLLYWGGGPRLCLSAFSIKTFLILSTDNEFSHIAATIVSQSYFLVLTWKLILEGWGVRNEGHGNEPGYRDKYHIWYH